MNSYKILQSTDQDNDPNTHYFRLASKNTFDDIVADFTPVNAISQNNNLRAYSILPTFNLDKRSFTDAFINPYQGLEPVEELTKKFNNRILVYSEEISSDQIMIPRPRSHKNKCAVCHCRYRDYLQHILTQDHKTAIKFNRYNLQILELHQLFNHPKKQKKVLKKNQNIRNIRKVLRSQKQQ